MKTIKMLLLLVAFSTATFYSCSDENSIKTETTAQKSTALRTVLNKLKLENTVGPNRSAVVSATPPNPMLCFDFVFPITFSYNNGTTITATSLDGLLDILNNESPTLFLEAVVFPFQVQYGGAVHTINNEAELLALIIQCGLPTFNDDLLHTYCFDIVFPITLVTSNNQIVAIGSKEELNSYLMNLDNGIEVQIAFPISVINNNQTVVLNSVYDFYDMVNSCNENNCICTLEYAPVCVQTPNGIVEYGNLCFAQCAGYTQNDLVPCNPASECSITNLTATPGICNPATFQYPVTINFNPGNTTATHFEVYSSSNLLLGVYPIASLPVTIENYPESILGAPNLNLVTVKINENNENCTATQSFTIPNCSPCNCPTDFNPVCVQANGQIVQYSNACLAQCAGYSTASFVNCNTPVTYNFGQLLGSCFSIVYPVNVQYQGAIRQVFSDGELLQYWNPAFSQMPVMNYPIVATFGNSLFTFNDQTAFENQIHVSCP